MKNTLRYTLRSIAFLGLLVAFVGCGGGSKSSGSSSPTPPPNPTPAPAAASATAPATVPAQVAESKVAVGEDKKADEKKEDDSDDPFGPPKKKTATAAVGSALFRAAFGKGTTSAPTPLPGVPPFAPKP